MLLVLLYATLFNNNNNYLEEIQTLKIHILIKTARQHSFMRARSLAQFEYVLPLPFLPEAEVTHGAARARCA